MARDNSDLTLRWPIADAQLETMAVRGNQTSIRYMPKKTRVEGSEWAKTTNWLTGGSRQRESDRHITDWETPNYYPYVVTWVVGSQ